MVELTPSAINALQIYEYEETKKYGVVNEFDEAIKKDPVAAFKELGISKIVTPGFLKYFEDYEYEWINFSDFENLYTIEDPKFEYLNKDCKCIEMMREIYRLAMDDNVARYMILKNLNIKMGCEVPPDVLEMLYKIKAMKVELEMKHDSRDESPHYLGNIQIIEEEKNKFRIVNGNHRLLAYMYYCLNMNAEFEEVKVLIGRKVGSR